MEERIRKHMAMLFEAAPKTRRAMELKEEMTQNTIEKYEDLLGEGYSEEDAFLNVTESIGDVTELFSAVEEVNPLRLSEADRRKKAMINAIAVGMYILAGVALFMGVLVDDAGIRIAGNMEPVLLGLVVAGIICIIPTCMLVYAANMYPNYRKKEENLVEAYKESYSASKKEKEVKEVVSAIIWMVTLLLYFFVSFGTMAWHITWLLFLVGGCMQLISDLVFSLRRKEGV